MPCAPATVWLIRCVVPACQSRRNTSVVPLVSPGTRFVAFEENATYRPLALIVALLLSLLRLVWDPVLDTSIRRVVPASRSRRKTSFPPSW